MDALQFVFILVVLCIASTVHWSEWCLFFFDLLFIVLEYVAFNKKDAQVHGTP